MPIRLVLKDLVIGFVIVLVWISLWGSIEILIDLMLNSMGRNNPYARLLVYGTLFLISVALMVYLNKESLLDVD